MKHKKCKHAEDCDKYNEDIDDLFEFGCPIFINARNTAECARYVDYERGIRQLRSDSEE